MDKAGRAKTLRKVDWLTLEMEIRDYLRQVNNGSLAAMSALLAIDDVVAETTGRGEEIIRTLA